MEIANVLFKLRPELRDLLSRTTLRRLDEITELRGANPTDSQWDKHFCGCEGCRALDITPLESYTMKKVYAHLNKNRTAADREWDQRGSYKENTFVDAQLLFEVVLGLRHPDGSPRDGVGLSILDRCCVCHHETQRHVLKLDTDSDKCPRGSTQFHLKQRTTADRRFQKTGPPSHTALHDRQQQQVRSIGGSRCLNRNCTMDGRFADTSLPMSLDPTTVPPAFLRINKRRLAKNLNSVCETVTLTYPDVWETVTYQLVAVVYASSSHFTADIRYKLPDGDRQFFHYDPFHFPRDRILPLSNNLPACARGTPTFQAHHTKDAKTKFRTCTTYADVISVVYVRQRPPASDSSDEQKDADIIHSDPNQVSSNPKAFDCFVTNSPQPLALHCMPLPFPLSSVVLHAYHSYALRTYRRVRLVPAVTRVP